MKFIIFAMSALNLYFGIRFLLNALHILHTSKYAQSSNIVFSILFIALGLTALYFVIFKHNNQLGLLFSIGPWVLGLLFLLINMLLGDYK
jgi:hypothetical protein